MPSQPPSLVAIEPDDYHAEHVGRTEDGRQFFLTNPFEPTIGGREGCEFVALYIFDSEGTLLEAMIDSFGPRDSVDEEAQSSLYEKRLQGLGKISFQRIEVAPFGIEKFGSTFGLVLRHPENEGDPWAVEVQPGNYMAFFEPWDSGDYDT